MRIEAGFPLGVLTILLVVLRAVGAIHWPWIWVLAFTWMPLCAILSVVLIFLVFFFLATLIGVPMTVRPRMVPSKGF